MFAIGLFGYKGKNTVNFDDSEKLLNTEEKSGVSAVFFETSKGYIYKFTVTGSTGYSEYGTDIVAAAISALVENTINSLSVFTDKKAQSNKTEIDYEPYVECILPKVMKRQEKAYAQVLIYSLKLGLNAIQNTYGSEYLTVSEKK